MLLRLLFSIFILTITGCIAVPVNLFYDEPFQQEELNALVLGLDYEAVREILGEPHAVRDGGKFWFYGKTRPLIWLVGDGSDMTVEDYNWLELAFDESGKLLSLDFQEGKTGCSKNGNCLLWGAWDNRTMTDRAIFAAPEMKDISAKRLLSAVESCALYTYFDSSEVAVARFFLSDVTFKVQTNDMHPYFLNRDTYSYVEVSPGNVVIKALWFDKILEQVEMSCKSGTNYFLHIHQPGLLNRAKLSFAWENDDNGKKALSKKQLLLAP